MNLIHVREKVKEFRRLQIMTPQAEHAFLHAPLFLWNGRDNLTDDEMDWCEQNIMGKSEGKVATKIPYQDFILHVEFEPTPENKHFGNQFTLYVTGRKYAAKWAADHDSEHEVLLTIFWHVPQCGDQPWSVMLTQHDGLIENGIQVRHWKDGKLVNPDRTFEELTRLVNFPHHCLVKFCFDVMNPANVVLTVEPKSNGVPRSVQWRLARTHFLVLGHEEAKNCQKGKRGPTGDEITRASHYRRAHLRRLMSEKFTHKQGQLVFVHQAWVGPEEWVGFDGKIYRVKSPVT